MIGLEEDAMKAPFSEHRISPDRSIALAIIFRRDPLDSAAAMREKVRKLITAKNEKHRRVG